MKDKVKESRLLTDEESDLESCSSDYISMLIHQGIQNAKTAQDAKTASITASIKDAECQARVEKLIKELQGIYNQANDLRTMERLLRDWLYENRKTLEEEVLVDEISG